VAEVAARRGEGLGELRRLDLSRRLEEERSEDERFKKTEAVWGEYAGSERLEAPRRTIHGEHRTFAKKGFNAHR